MKFSVIVPTYNDEKNSWKVEKYLKQCLTSIDMFTTETDIEIIVVTNGCEKTTFDMLDKFQNTHDIDLKYISIPKALGYSKANNYGIAIAKGEFIILMNDDCVLLPQSPNLWLELLVGGFSSKEVVITGPCPASFLGREFLIGFCLMVRKSFFDESGGLDEEFSPGWGEDIDLCLRAKKMGYQFKQVGVMNEASNNLNIGSFPIYHVGEATFDLYPELVKQGQALHQKMIDRINNGYYDFKYRFYADAYKNQVPCLLEKIG